MFVDANKAYKELGFIYGSHGVGRELHHIVLKEDEKTLNNIMEALMPFRSEPNLQSSIEMLAAYVYDDDYVYGGFEHDERYYANMTPEKVLQNMTRHLSLEDLTNVANSESFLLVNVTPDSYNFVEGDPEMFKMVKERLK